MSTEESIEDKRYRLEQESAERLKRTEFEQCGTVAGYLRHTRAKPKERACAPCRAAWRLYYRQYLRDPVKRARWNKNALAAYHNRKEGTPGP